MFRESRGLGQKEVAAKLGMPVRTYGGYERGERTLSLDIAAQIADVFEITLDELLGRESQGRHAHTSVDLTRDERELVDLYRKADARQRARVMEELRDYADLSGSRAAGHVDNTVRAGRLVSS